LRCSSQLEEGREGTKTADEKSKGSENILDTEERLQGQLMKKEKAKRTAHERRKG
jgi:hypothetical protein